VQKRHAVPAINTAIRLGKVIQFEDTQPIPLDRFVLDIATISRGWPAPRGVADGQVFAYVDFGRWLANCPHRCGGAEMVSEVYPFFYCLSCGGDGTWWPVVFPDNARRIEVELLKRKVVEGWAWVPGESLAFLRRETKVINAAAQETE